MRIATGPALLLALALAACADAPASQHAASSTMPPARLADCLDITLLDDVCTRAWYRCRSGEGGGESCIAAWEDCCTLPGQGARSRLGGAQSVTHH
jgi:hypothetical protein